MHKTSINYNWLTHCFCISSEAKPEHSGNTALVFAKLWAPSSKVIALYTFWYYWLTLSIGHAQTDTVVYWRQPVIAKLLGLGLGPLRWRTGIGLLRCWLVDMFVMNAPLNWPILRRLINRMCVTVAWHEFRKQQPEERAINKLNYSYITVVKRVYVNEV